MLSPYLWDRHHCHYTHFDFPVQFGGCNEQHEYLYSYQLDDHTYQVKIRHIFADHGNTQIKRASRNYFRGNDTL